MSKKFNANAIVDERKNELDNSPLFQSKKPASELIIKSPSTSTSPTPKQPVQEVSKKTFIRRTFDFYEEQIIYLKQESLREQLAGKEGSMNAMVREALDDWIKKRTNP